jgi:hypothetical protein
MIRACPSSHLFTHKLAPQGLIIILSMGCVNPEVQGYPMPRGIAGPPCLLGSKIQRSSHAVQGLGERLTTSHCKISHLSKLEEQAAKA